MRSTIGLQCLGDELAFKQLNRISLFGRPARRTATPALGERLLVGLQGLRRILEPATNVEGASNTTALYAATSLTFSGRQNVDGHARLTSTWPNLLGDLSRRARAWWR